MSKRTVTVDVDVDVDIDDFDTDDLIDELEDRGYVVLDEKEERSRETRLERILWLIRQSYITDNPENFHKLLERKLLDAGMPV
jgi:hypothetical protein